MIDQGTTNAFSVVVVTYNQEDLVESCLNSIRDQDYESVELIVSDDASTDGTMDIIQRWLKKHVDRFQNVTCLQQPENIGISANHTHAVRQSRGKYVKYIGGDDYLAEGALSSMADFFERHPDISWACGQVIPFFLNVEGVKIQMNPLPTPQSRACFSTDSWRQFRHLAVANFISAAGTFFRRDVLTGCGYFDADFRRFEDWHTWLKLTSQGYPAGLADFITTYWRRHAGSVQTRAEFLGDREFVRERIEVLKRYVWPHRHRLHLQQKLHVRVRLKYFQRFLDLGGDTAAHYKSRWILLGSPYWWLNMLLYLKKKCFGKKKFSEYERAIFS